MAVLPNKKRATREEELVLVVRAFLKATEKVADAATFPIGAPADAYQLLSETRITLGDVQEMKLVRMVALSIPGV